MANGTVGALTTCQLMADNVIHSGLCLMSTVVHSRQHIQHAIFRKEPEKLHAVDHIGCNFCFFNLWSDFMNTVLLLTELEYLRRVQFGIVASEKLAGNIVKEESAKGASTGLLMAQNVVRKIAKEEAQKQSTSSTNKQMVQLLSDWSTENLNFTQSVRFKKYLNSVAQQNH